MCSGRGCYYYVLVFPLVIEPPKSVEGGQPGAARNHMPGGAVTRGEIRKIALARTPHIKGGGF